MVAPQNAKSPPKKTPGLRPEVKAASPPPPRDVVTKQVDQNITMTMTRAATNMREGREVGATAGFNK